MVKCPHCWLLAKKLVPSTCKYRVLTVWDLSLLNRAILEPDGMHTTRKEKSKSMYVKERGSEREGENRKGGGKRGNTPCKMYMRANYIYLHSGFFKDCFFLDGLEMTFILFERNVPVSRPSSKNIWMSRIVHKWLFIAVELDLNACIGSITVGNCFLL